VTREQLDDAVRRVQQQQQPVQTAQAAGPKWYVVYTPTQVIKNQCMGQRFPIDVVLQEYHITDRYIGPDPVAQPAHNIENGLVNQISDGPVAVKGLESCRRVTSFVWSQNATMDHSGGLATIIWCGQEDKESCMWATSGTWRIGTQADLDRLRVTSR
jgi:hypothetical protein